MDEYTTKKWEGMVPEPDQHDCRPGDLVVTLTRDEARIARVLDVRYVPISKECPLGRSVRTERVKTYARPFDLDCVLRERDQIARAEAGDG